MSDTVELLSSVVSGIGWLNAILTMGLAIVAIVKLRATPSGLLLFVGFGAMSLCNASAKIYRTVALDIETGDIDVYMDQMRAIMWTTSVTNILLYLVVAIGVGLIPMSLRRLSQRAAATA